MSWKAQAWASEQRTGSASTKLVLMIYASFANERGWAYPSNPTVAEISELNPKTVRESIDKLEQIGLLIDTGRRTGRTKQVKVFQLGMESLPKPDALPAGKALDGGGEPAEPRQATPPETLPKPGGLKATDLCGKDSQKREAEPTKEPLPPDSASALSAPRGAGRDRGIPISEDWQPPALADLPPSAKRISEQWPVGAYEAEAEAFRNYWLGEGRAGSRKRDWKRAWYNRITDIASKPIRDAKAGVHFVTPNTMTGRYATEDAQRAYLANLERRTGAGGQA